MKKCSSCTTEKPLAEFYKRKHSTDGYQSSCKECMRITYTSCRSANLDRYKAVQQQRYTDIRERYREWKRERGCACCAETEPVCLQLHHLDPALKEFKPADLLSYSWKKLMREAEKCIVVCGNCHAKIHAEIVTETKDGSPVFIST